MPLTQTDLESINSCLEDLEYYTLRRKEKNAALKEKKW